MKKKVIRIATVPNAIAVLLKGQLKMLSNYYDVIAVSSPGDEIALIIKNENVRVIPLLIKRRISIFKDIRSLIKMIILLHEEKPDMVHSITPKAGLISMVAAWINRVPVRAHTFTGLIFPSKKGIIRKILIFMDKITCYCATNVYPEGKGVMNDLIRYGITKKPMHIIANGNVNGIDTSYFDVTLFDKVSNSLYTFIFIGRIVKDKGINELVSSFQKLYKKYSFIQLLLVGSFEKEFDPISIETERLIYSHPGIKYYGYQSDVRHYLANSDTFVFPSYREGFPNVVLQAGAMGLPQIVTDINGCNEIIIDGINGKIIPPQNEQALYNMMEYFIKNSSEVEKMASNAREMITSRYEQKMVWDAILSEYKTILAD